MHGTDAGTGDDAAADHVKRTLAALRMAVALQA